MPISAVVPSGRLMPLRVRVLLEALEVLRNRIAPDGSSMSRHKPMARARRAQVSTLAFDLDSPPN